MTIVKRSAVKGACRGLLTLACQREAATPEPMPERDGCPALRGNQTRRFMGHGVPLHDSSDS